MADNLSEYHHLFSFRTQSAYLTCIKMELTNIDVLCLVSFRREGPFDCRVVVALAMVERSAIYTIFGPHLFITIDLSVSLICFAVFLPLVHLDLSFQSIAVRHLYPELLVDKLGHVYRCARHMNQLELIRIIHILTVDLADSLAAFSHELREGHELLFILPEEHQGEGYKKASYDERTDTHLV